MLTAPRALGKKSARRMSLFLSPETIGLARCRDSTRAGKAKVHPFNGFINPGVFLISVSIRANCLENYKASVGPLNGRLPDAIGHSLLTGKPRRTYGFPEDSAK